MAPVNALLFVFGMVPSVSLPSPLRGCHRRKHSGASERFCSPYGGFCLQMCVLCCLGSMPSFSLCPRWPRKGCHHGIAGNRCPGTSSWLCPGKQMVISSKSSEVSSVVFDYDSSPPSDSSASGVPRVQNGMLPIRWHATSSHCHPLMFLRSSFSVPSLFFVTASDACAKVASW